MSRQPKIDPQRCTPSARRRADPLLATAAPATGWFLVERPGAWGRQAVQQSHLNPEIADALIKKCSAHAVRIQTIRRPPDRADPDRPRRWAYVDSGPDSAQVSWWGDYVEDDELLELRLDGSQGTASVQPVLLVCTHARHDACCALYGRPVYHALANAFPEMTWETSHVGGDRFAANLVILPQGLYYGGLDGETALSVVGRHRAGLLDPVHLRGRSSSSAPVQAAEHYLREQVGDYRIDAVRLLDLEHLGVAEWTVRLSQGDREYQVHVLARHTAALHRLTCSAMHPAASRIFELVNLRDMGHRPKHS